MVYRHLFDPDGPRACSECRDRAREAPGVPCAQERLYDRLVSARVVQPSGEFVVLLPEDGAEPVIGWSGAVSREW